MATTKKPKPGLFVVAALTACVLFAQADNASAASCETRDKQFMASILPRYEAMVASERRLRNLILRNGPAAARLREQLAGWRAVVRFGDAARSVSPCHRVLGQIRLLAVEMGIRGTEMLSVAQALQTGQIDSATATRLLYKKNGELQVRAERLNRIAARFATS